LKIGEKIDLKQLDMGMSMLQSFLKRIDIVVKEKEVHVTYILEFPDETIAKTFAEGLKKTYEEGL